MSQNRKMDKLVVVVVYCLRGYYPGWEELLIHTTWMNQTGIMLSKRSHRRRVHTV